MAGEEGWSRKAIFSTSIPLHEFLTCHTHCKALACSTGLCSSSATFFVALYNHSFTNTLTNANHAACGFNSAEDSTSPPPPTADATSCTCPAWSWECPPEVMLWEWNMSSKGEGTEFGRWAKMVW